MVFKKRTKKKQKKSCEKNDFKSPKYILKLYEKNCLMQRIVKQLNLHIFFDSQLKKQVQKFEITQKNTQTHIKEKQMKKTTSTTN